MYRVRLLGNVYRPAPQGVVDLVDLPEEGWLEVDVYALDIETAREGEAIRYGAFEVRADGSWYGRHINLQTKLYRFPQEEEERRALENLLASARWLWLDYGTYPAPTCSATQAVAVECESIETEHRHDLGGKFVRAVLWLTRR